MGIRIGAHYIENGVCEFVVWAPLVKEISLQLLFSERKALPLARDERGYWRITVQDVEPGTQYLFLINSTEAWPDPASQFQPHGVHGCSAVVSHVDFSWSDQEWKGVAQERLVIYELHVGTFTPAGTLDAIIPRLQALRELGINAIELMPIAEFPGSRNWGYDGVYPFSVHSDYGGPDALKRLVDACHRQGIAVILDVVYNHLGPEGNYISRFAPYFTKKYQTPWGEALNFDEAWSDGVRNYFIENALHWFRDYHLDGLRLDAVHAIFDQSERPFLQELSLAVREFGVQQGREYFLIGESNLNDPRLTHSPDEDGMGLQTVWCDDFHHSLRALITGERRSYFADFGELSDLVKAMREGFVYSGQYSAYRKRTHGKPSADLPGRQFVVFAQNHDQIGNRMHGERLTELISFEALKLCAGAVLLAPYIPMLFMGEEYGETAPFLYFVSHGDADLIRAVQEGRKAEYRHFGWHGNPPDPQSPETFLRSKIDWEKRAQGRHGILLGYYRELIRQRSEIPALSHLDKSSMEVIGHDPRRLLSMRRWHADSQIFCAMNLGTSPEEVQVDLPPGRWRKLLASAEPRWGGNGSPQPMTISAGHILTVEPMSLLLYKRE